MAAFPQRMPEPVGPVAATSDRHAPTAMALLREALKDLKPRDFEVRLWDGSAWGHEPDRPRRFTLVVRHPGALRALLGSPDELTLGEAYVYDDIDVEGDVESAIALVGAHLLGRRPGFARRLRLAARLLALPSLRRRPGRPSGRLAGAPHSKVRDQMAVTYHYNVSNAFYSLWLDRRMVYSCAYFASAADDLDAAQERKLDYICRKLRLKAGERFLDVGCGWGGLLLHAAGRYGAQAVGITLSAPQAEWANERIRRAGLASRCRVEIRDYREMDAPESYDKIASVGMFEHVGESRLPEYFARAFRLLRPGGAFLNHGIAVNPAVPANPGRSFSDHYVFPDGQLLPLSVTLRAAEESGFEVRDVESLREHYVVTLRHWLRRLEARKEDAVRLSDERTYRIWRLYMAGAARTFFTGRNSVYQVLLSRPDQGYGGLPRSRADWYA